MKHLIYLICISAFLACSTSKSAYNEGYTNNIPQLIDSISKSESIQIEDTAIWDKTYLLSNNGPIKIYLYYKKLKKQQYFISIFKEDSLYFYRYRKE